MDESKVAIARRAAGLQAGEVAQALQISRPTLRLKESDPNRMTIGELKTLFEMLNPEGKGIVGDYVSALFLSD